MSDLFTKNGIPLFLRGDRIFNPSGANFGYVRQDRVFGLNGRYRGTIISDRLIYRPTNSVGGMRKATARIATMRSAPRGESALWGDEPNIEA